MNHSYLIERTQQRVSELKKFRDTANWATSKVHKKSIEESLEINELLLKVLFEQYASSCNIRSKELSSNQLGF